MVAKTFVLALLAAFAVAKPAPSAAGDDAAGPSDGADMPPRTGVPAEDGRRHHGRHRHGHRHLRGSGIAAPTDYKLRSDLSTPTPIPVAPTTLFTSVIPTSEAVITTTTAAEGDDGSDDTEGGDDDSGSDSESDGSSSTDATTTAAQSVTPTLPAADEPTDDASTTDSTDDSTDDATDDSTDDSTDDTDLKRRDGTTTAAASTTRRRRRHRSRRTRTRTSTTVTQVVDVTTVTTVTAVTTAASTAATPVTSAAVDTEALQQKVKVPAAVAAPAPVTTPASVAAPAPAPATSASTSRTTSAAAAATSATTATGAKKGLSYNDASLLSAWTGKAAWAYNWSPKPDGTLPSGISFLPMKWCPETAISAANIASFSSAVASAGATRVLSFNEPDLDGQCNIDVSRAVAGHKAYFAPIAAKGGIKVGSPAVTNGGGSMGLTYLGNFLKQCGGGKDCPVDFLAVHWYGDSAADFKRHVTAAVQLATDHGISETFVTEFALNGDDNAKQAAFVTEVVPWLEQQAGVGGYAYFMASDGRLNSGKSISNTLGSAYASS